MRFLVTCYRDALRQILSQDRANRNFLSQDILVVESVGRKVLMDADSRIPTYCD
jgi:hypothetical protein